ncbi:uroporphyrinogen-III synthase [Pseudoneobacillus sp. C159]
MNGHLPLLGKKVLVPRGKYESKSFSTLVEKYGGVPLEIPLLAFRPIQPSIETETILKKVNTYDWIIFTSNVTVETFLSFYQNGAPTLPRVAVIGKKTAEVLSQKGYQAQFIPEEYVAEGFVEEFLPLVESGMKILIPKGNLARDYIAQSLKRGGAHVDEVIAYETYMPEDSKSQLKSAIANGEIDILPFTSPSTVEHFMDVINEYELHRELENYIISCIGPVTKEKIESMGLRVDVMPEIYTVEDMLKEIVIYLQRIH